MDKTLIPEKTDILQPPLPPNRRAVHRLQLKTGLRWATCYDLLVNGYVFKSEVPITEFSTDSWSKYNNEDVVIKE